MAKRQKFIRLRTALLKAGLQGNDVAQLLGLQPDNVSKRLAGTVQWTLEEQAVLKAALAWKGHGLFKP